MISLPLPLFVIVAAFIWVLYLYINRSAGPLPPGPKGWPIIGNILDMPACDEWVTFAKWGEAYGQ